MKFYRLKDVKCSECGADIIFGIATSSGGKTEDLMESLSNPIDVDAAHIEAVAAYEEDKVYENRRKELDRFTVQFYTKKYFKEGLTFDEMPEKYREDVRQNVANIILDDALNNEKKTTTEEKPEPEEKPSFMDKLSKRPGVYVYQGICIAVLLLIVLVGITNMITMFNRNNQPDNPLVNIGETGLVEMLEDELVEGTLELVKSAVNSGDVVYRVTESLDDGFNFIRATYTLPDGSVLYARFQYVDYEGEWTLNEWYIELPAEIGGVVG